MNRFFGFILLGLFTFTFSLFSQSSDVQGKISGSILDAQSGQPIPGATVVLKKIKDSVITGGAIANSKGLFSINKIPKGKYFLQASVIGYTPKVTQITISDKNLNVKLDDIKLMEADVHKEGVQVTAEREVIQAAIDKKVVNVEKMVATTGGTALDLLQNIPSVSVDMDGNVSLRGSQNVQILIDGKPSGMTGSEVLDQLPASTIDQIELITNPSAKFDAEGQAGVINIVLKKKRDEGFNGLVTATAGTLDKYNGSVNLNYHTGDFNFITTYDVRYFRMLGKGLLNQNTINSTGNYTNLFQDDEFSRKGYSHNLKFGMEYYLDDFNSFSGSVLFNTGTRDGSEVRTNTFTDGSLVNNYETNTSELFPMNSFDYRLGYKHNFGKRNNDLTVDFIYTPTTRNHTLNLYDPWPPVTSSDSITNTTNFIDNKAYVLQSDYINTFDKDTKIEAGLKVSYKDINNDYGYNNIINNVTIPNAALSNTFDYREFITALYASYSGTLGSFKYQAGLRSEYTSLNNRLLKPTDTTTHKNYLDFFPSAFLQYNFDEINAIQLNWTRRIDRPNPRQLNPFTDYSDPLNLEKGNPDLDPQYSNNFELGYLWISGKTTINPTAFFKYRTGDISDWKELIDSTNGITMTIPRNMNKSQSYGLDFIISHEFFKGWHADGNFSYFKQELFGSVPRTDAFNHILPDSSFTNSSNSWTMKLNTVVNLFGLADLQMSANYNSPVVTAQGTRDANWWADMGLKMDVLEGKGTINLRVSDIFNTQRWVHSSIGPGFYDTTNWKRVSQGAFLGFTYRFNDYKKAKDKHNGDNPGMDEDY